MSDRLYIKKTSETEIAAANTAVEGYIERIFDSPEDYRHTLDSAKFSDSIAEASIQDSEQP